MQWHEAMPQRWKREQAIAAASLEDFEAGIEGTGCAFVRGLFHVVSEHGHVYETVKLRITYPPNFPARNQSPSVYLESHRDSWEKGGDSHIEDDWRLCLFVPGESGIDFGEATSLNDLLAVTHTFLFKQRIFQRRLVRSRLDGRKAKWPGEDRSHGLQGIREAVRDAGGIGRNDPCPCGSGRKFKHCHLGRL
ncbi:MAG: SEC-C domain-containing protein [Planctomycetes bacterium]|nr:SEC-C domain-containing protein [Planctomycetota bacterium]